MRVGTATTVKVSRRSNREVTASKTRPLLGPRHAHSCGTIPQAPNCLGTGRKKRLLPRSNKFECQGETGPVCSGAISLLWDKLTRLSGCVRATGGRDEHEIGLHLGVTGFRLLWLYNVREVTLSASARVFLSATSSALCKASPDGRPQCGSRTNTTDGRKG